MDTVNSKTRSKIMAAVRSKDTSIELKIRRRLFRKGFRYRLHHSGLPGRPDLVFPKFRAVGFIHGCFWHNHGCPLSGYPKTRPDWWKQKLLDNRDRDKRSISDLKNLGWRVLIVWECSFRAKQTSEMEALDRVVEESARFLQSDFDFLEISGV